MQIIDTSLEGGALLRSYIHERINGERPYLRPAVLILPGGGYEHVSKRESEPVALEFLSRGYQAFVLTYTVKRENIALSEPEKEVADALVYIKENALRFDTFQDKIVLLGFSAGAHLALSSQCHYKALNKNSKVDALVLSYPVVTMGEYGHDGSIYNLTGGDEERKRYYSLEYEVTKDLPPVFMWHTTEDETVSPMNSLYLSSSLLKAGVPFEYHLFEKGKHGLSICTRDVGKREERTSRWLELLFSWLEETLDWKQ